MEDTGGSKRANPIDVLVGERVRLQRTVLGMSQGTLGAKVGVTFQQVQKYEKGTNRIGASRLQAISQVLGVPVGFFFEGKGAPAVGDSRAGAHTPGSLTVEGLRLNIAFLKIGDGSIRHRIVELVRSLADAANAHLP